MEERRIRRLDSDGLWNFALKALAARACSVGELREKLRRRAQQEGDVEATISRLIEYRYLDDRRFAEGFAGARLSNEKHGRARVVRDLRQRRVAPPLAEKIVKEVYREIDEESLIEEWIRRKYRAAPREGLFGDEKALAAAYRRLMRAGFRTGEIVKALKRFAKDPDLLDGFEPPQEEE